MLKNYLKITIRNILKHKTFTFLNLSALVIGISSLITIFLFIQDEYKFDKYHKNKERIFRIVNVDENSGNIHANGPAKLLSVTEDIPEIEMGVRILKRPELVTRIENRIFFEDYIFADKEVFNLFSFDLITGHPETVLTDPYTVVISESMAKKYFGDFNPVGQTLNLENSGDYRITGVMKDIPKHSHFRSDFIASLETIKVTNPNYFTKWYISAVYSYILINPETPADIVVQKLNRTVYNQTNNKSNILLEALEDIYLYHYDDQWDLAQHGNIYYIYAFSAVALLILLMSCFNYMNLSVARSFLRFKEAAIRKIMGSSDIKLIQLFLFETFCITLIAIALSIVTIELILPFVNNFTGKELSLDLMENFSLLFLIIVTLGFIIIAGGGYSALILSKIQPLNIISGKFFSGSFSFQNSGKIKFGFRQILVLTQFVITIVLIVTAVFIKKQMDYIGSKHLGVDREECLVIENPYGKNQFERFKRIKEFGLNNEKIISVSAANNVPPGDINNYCPIELQISGKKEKINVAKVFTDYDFFKTLNSKILKGRNFSSELDHPKSLKVILNEAAAEKLNDENLIGKHLMDLNENLNYQITGIVNDIHYKSLHHNVYPIIFIPGIYDYSAKILVRISDENISHTISDINQFWSSIAPEWPMKYSFLDENFNKLYKAEKYNSVILNLFTGCSIIISVLGLIGMVSLSVERREKEICIRKVLGAEIGNILMMLSKDYVAIILIANIVAFPIAYKVITTWLDDFAFKTSITPGVFLSGGIITFLLSFTVILLIIQKNARSNPAEKLGNE